MHTHFYHWPSEADALTAGVLVEDAESGAVNAAPGWTQTPGPVWLTAPVMSEPDPETGEQTVVTPGEQSGPIVLLSADPVAALAANEIYPEGHGGFA